MDRSGSKRAPAAVVFDMNDELHLEFVCAAARMKAQMHQLAHDPALWANASYMKAVLSTVHVDPFK